MPNYDWRKFRESPWNARYPEYALGYSFWQETQDLEELLSRIIQARIGRRGNRNGVVELHPRHRRDDAQYTRFRVATV